MNGPRFQSALQIMEDLELIRSDNPEHQTYTLLPEGKDLLQRFRAYEVPVPE
jgi:predicted transcriptional regulator